MTAPILHLVRQMRAFQKSYFATKNQEDLKRSKQLEREVDELLDLYAKETSAVDAEHGLYRLEAILDQMWEQLKKTSEAYQAKHGQGNIPESITQSSMRLDELSRIRVLLEGTLDENIKVLRTIIYVRETLGKYVLTSKGKFPTEIMADVADKMNEEFMPRLNETYEIVLKSRYGKK